MAACPRDGSESVLRIVKDLGDVRVGEPLSRHTTFRIGGPAWGLFRPDTAQACVEAVVRARAAGLPWRLLGGGSNVLFDDHGFPGLIISTLGLTTLRTEGQIIVAGAGVKLSELSVPALTGIPGTVGGAVTMNAGTRYGQIGDKVEWVRALLPDGRLVTLPKEECGFAYRESLFHRFKIPVIEVGLRNDQAEDGLDLSAAIQAERRAKEPRLPSAGCVFRNPKDAPAAGWLIDRAGLKGTRIGDAVVSKRHANFICNLGHAKAADVLALVDRVRERVVQTFGIWLELEIDVVMT